ncbi:MAG: aspartyl/glutamyl-tRNA amidotransferase subunit A [Spirochaetaceae bacterium]|jgi:aspartyl-tRNA(Asn)/glutamyl-tRNA(Gln) amidotransferase subunit A|nr:aspartyl/glutamyl-tRNA amidotransferase subunit A [Spirochaetaceae bacterium]
MTLPDGYDAYFKEWEEKIGAFIEFAPERAADGGKTASPLCGLPFAVKDNIAVKGFSLSCGSKLLANLTSPYTASAVKKLEEAGAAVIGKTNLDEFGMGSSTDNSGIKRTNNPWDVSRVAGGSSGGSAAAVAAGLAPFALGSDTGGSVRQPASFCGVAGLKPTWGAVSRFGLVAYASSLDTVGILADGIDRCRAVFDCVKGADPLDQTSRNAPEADAPVCGSVIGVLSPSAVARAIADDFSGEAAIRLSAGAVLEPEVEKSFEMAKENLKKLGYTLVEIDIPSLKYGVPAYYTIAAAEASANLARFDGIRYGKRPDWAENPDELVEKSRDGGFGDEVKLRILLGTFVLRSGFQDRFYLRAQRLRAGIRRDFEKHLGAPGESGNCAAILAPVFPTGAFGRGGAGLSPFAQKAADLYTCCANLAGLPALAFPVSAEGGLPSGVQLLGRSFGEETLFSIAERYEAAHPFPHPPGFKPFWGGSKE